jgi:hypothetical protein
MIASLPSENLALFCEQTPQASPLKSIVDSQIVNVARSARHSFEINRSKRDGDPSSHHFFARSIFGGDYKNFSIRVLFEFGVISFEKPFERR